MTEDEKNIVYQEYHEKILNYVYYHTRSIDVASDLTQDIFMKIFNNIDSFDDSKASLSTWIYTIAKNKLIDYYRTRKENVEFDEAFINEFVDEDKITEDELTKIASAIKDLDNREREIIIKHYYEGISLKDIATNMNLSYIFVKVLHKKALESLKLNINRTHNL